MVKTLSIWFAVSVHTLLSWSILYLLLDSWLHCQSHGRSNEALTFHKLLIVKTFKSQVVGWWLNKATAIVTEMLQWGLSDIMTLICFPIQHYLNYLIHFHVFFEAEQISLRQEVGMLRALSTLSVWALWHWSVEVMGLVFRAVPALCVRGITLRQRI